MANLSSAKPEKGESFLGSGSLSEIEAQVASRFTFDNCPHDYASLTEEAAFLPRLSGYAFIQMAKRVYVSVCPGNFSLSQRRVISKRSTKL